MTKSKPLAHATPSPSSQAIPQLIHRIWFGSSLPEKYQTNLKDLVKNNSDYRVNLWADFSIISQEDKKNLMHFCQTNRIQLFNIRTQHYLSNYKLITEELDQSNSAIRNRRVHFARASDLARVAILIAHGGVYSDTDTQSLKALPQLSARFGVLFKEFPGFNQAFLDADDVHHLFYDFIAAAPENELLKLAAKISELDYSTYHNTSRKWEDSNATTIQQLGTVRLTGSALRWAAQYFISHEQIKPTHRPDLFFSDIEYLFPDYDRSWLEQNSESGTPQEWDSLFHFQERIEQERARTYPLNFEFIVHRFADKAGLSLNKLKKYAVNITVLEAINELEVLLKNIKTSNLKNMNSDEFTKKQQQLEQILNKMTRITDQCFEGKEAPLSLISVLRNLFNEITSLFTGTKENSNWLAEKVVNRPFFLIKPRTETEQTKIEIELNKLEDEQYIAKKLFTK